MGERLQPLGAGADVVLHSATKYLGGHSDLMLGAAVAWDDELTRRLRERRLLTGAIPLTWTEKSVFVSFESERLAVCVVRDTGATGAQSAKARASRSAAELASKFTDFRDSTAAPAA
jgi:O-acetylhomoserine/O-acetylserine sulfhydrylase-like pyridoxal-dependent enzyme